MSTTSKTNYPTKSVPRVGLLTIFRLGLFNMGLGLMAVLTLAVLNRVMISELAIPATITAGVLAGSQFVAPVRVWFGQISDNKPLFGLYRTNYVRLGTALFGLAVFLAVQVVWQLGTITRTHQGWVWNSQSVTLTVLLGFIFVLYGLAIASCSTPFTALLVDISEPDNRSKIVTVVWSMLMVGIVIGAITGKIVLKKAQLGANIGTQLLTGEQTIATPLETLQPPINSIFVIVPLVVLAIAIIATWGVEKKYSRFRSRSSSSNQREDSISLGRALKILTASPQTGIFFSFLVLLTFSLFMQEAVLEPYGGEVFGMSIGETTFLNAFWGIGILIGYSITGFLVVPRLGKTLTTKYGCVLVAISFFLIIIAGFTHEEAILKAAVLLFGVAAGVATIGSINLMLDLTAAETAGTFIGAWGLA
ncbi:MAG: BCD family MFS transporter, partial [Prochloron sp. SP5CPC1]|nr:BCD family MFS transporter [Candidatus Paraprochloron terpiosi SP5CPC1]